MDPDDRLKTIAVPRLQRRRRNSVLKSSGRLMPLRRQRSTTGAAQYESVIVDQPTEPSGSPAGQPLESPPADQQGTESWTLPTPPSLPAVGTVEVVAEEPVQVVAEEPVQVVAEEPPSSPIAPTAPRAFASVVALLALAALAFASWQAWIVLEL